jgi:hypothetical protein
MREERERKPRPEREHPLGDVLFQASRMLGQVLTAQTPAFKQAAKEELVSRLENAVATAKTL